MQVGEELKVGDVVHVHGTEIQYTVERIANRELLPGMPVPRYQEPFYYGTIDGKEVGYPFSMIDLADHAE